MTLTPLIAVIGCLSSKAGGGSCSKGAAAAAGAKLVTIGFPGGGSPGKIIASIGVAGLVNGTNGATNAALGYLYNHTDNHYEEHDRGGFSPACEGSECVANGAVLVGGGAGPAIKALHRLGARFYHFTEIFRAFAVTPVDTLDDIIIRRQSEPTRIERNINE